jgi:hypothetical protein
MKMENIFANILISKTMVIISLFVLCVQFDQCLSSDEDPPRVGGFTKRDPNDETYKKLATTEFAKLHSVGGVLCQREIRKVAEVKTQVVAGTRYLIKVELCTPEMCNGQKQNPICDTCELDIWEKSWENFVQLSKVDCPKETKWNYSFSQ